MHTKAVFMDRDGVLNHAVVANRKPYPPKSLSELELIDGVAESCEKFRAVGALLFCFTNQPDVARGTAKKSEVEAINQHLKRTLKLDEIVACFHDDGDDCDCRKPKPGMILMLADKYNVKLEASMVVGDRWRDIEAGMRANCRTALIDYGYDERKVAADITAGSLLEAAPRIVHFLEKGTLK